MIIMIFFALIIMLRRVYAVPLTHMIIFVQAITLIMRSFSEERIMSVLTAIFQAIFQAICWIFPISESAHSAIFHDFSNRLSGACSSLTGIVHIGIAIGIIAALYKTFLTLAKEFFGSFADLAKQNKKSSRKEPKPARSFMQMSLISFIPMLFLFIPVGKGRLLYDLIRTSQFNGTLLDDGIFLAVTGLLVILSAKKLSLSANNKNISIVMAVLVGFASILLITVSGLSFVMGILAILLLMDVSKKSGYRYAMVLSVPVLVVMGIIEIVTSVTQVNWISAVIAVVVSSVVSFFAARVFRTLIHKNNIRCFGYYDIALGAISMIIGIFELILK